MKKLFWLSLLIVSFMLSSSLYAETAFSELEKNYKCKLIKNHLNEKDILKIDTKDYIVAWCNKGPNDEKSDYNLLIHYKNKKHDWANCPNFIEVSRITVLSLLGEKKPVVFYDGIPTLDKFWEVKSNPTKPLMHLKGIKATGSGLHIGWWDAGNVLYCHNKKWLMSGYH